MGRAVPTRIIQLIFPRVELHLFYNAVGFAPMVISMIMHRRPCWPGVAMLFLSLPNIGPALRAARLDGSAGVFRARLPGVRRHPGHESCSWMEDFRSGDGTVHRAGFTLHGGDSGSLRVGRHALAVDVGKPSRVYGARSQVTR
jgi:hypothetical protein